MGNTAQEVLPSRPAQAYLRSAKDRNREHRTKDCATAHHGGITVKQYVIILTEAQIDTLRRDGWALGVRADILAQADALDTADSDYQLNLEEE